MKGRGRTKKHYPPSEINNILYKYKEENGHVGLVKYLDVYRFSDELYRKGMLKDKFSEDFWRKSGRQGREVIDNLNELYLTTLKNRNEDNLTFVETENVIHKQLGLSNKERLEVIRKLKINEKNARKLNSNQKNLENKEREIRELRETVSKQEEQISIYQKVLFSWLAASYSTNNQLINTINTGKIDDPMIKHSFNQLFSNPHEGYKAFEEYAKNLIESNKENNIIDIKKTRIEKLLNKK